MKPLLHWLLTLAFTASAVAAQHFDVRSHGAKGDDLVRPEVGVLSITFDITRADSTRANCSMPSLKSNSPMHPQRTWLN